MITDIKHMGKFHVDFMRVVLDLPHEEIAKYTIDFVENNCDRYTTYHDHDVNKKWQDGLPSKDNFEADLYKLGNEFVGRSKRKKFKEDPFLFYWASVYKTGDQHGSHMHPNSLIAGTYYPQVSKESSTITFEAPWTSHLMHDTLDFSESLFDYKPNVGDAMLWPSWISHRVPVQKESDTLRVAISFNMDYKKYHL
jgi:uncharacterized protein (TIGR02466 family)